MDELSMHICIMFIQNILKFILNFENNLHSHTQRTQIDDWVFDAMVNEYSCMEYSCWFGLIKKKLTVEMPFYKIALFNQFVWCVYWCVRVNSLNDFEICRFWTRSNSIQMIQAVIFLALHAAIFAYLPWKFLEFYEFTKKWFVLNEKKTVTKKEWKKCGFFLNKCSKIFSYSVIIYESIDRIFEVLNIAFFVCFNLWTKTKLKRKICTFLVVCSICCDHNACFDNFSR